MRKHQILFVAGLMILIASMTVLAGTSVSPILTEITLPPGNSYEGDINVTNTGDKPIDIEVIVKGFTAPEGVPVFLDRASDDSTAGAIC